MKPEANQLAKQRVFIPQQMLRVIERNFLNTIKNAIKAL